VRFVHGTGLTFFTTASPTLTTDIAPPQHRGEILGHMSIASLFSMALGPIAGIAIFGRFGITWVVVACSLAGLIGLLLVLFIREPRGALAEKSSATYRQAVFTRSVLVPSAVLFIEAQIYGDSFTFLPLLLKDVGNQQVGLFFLIASGVMIVGRLLAAHFADVYGRGPMFFYSFLVIIASVMLVSQATSTGGLVAAALLYGIGSTVCLPALTALVADASEPRARGRVYSFFYGAFDVGVISAGVTLGFFSDLMGLRSMFLLAALMGLAAAIFFMLAIQPRVGPSLRWTLTGKGN